MLLNMGKRDILRHESNSHVRVSEQCVDILRQDLQLPHILDPHML